MRLPVTAAAALLALLAVDAPLASSQTVSAVISGQVTDITGAAVPGVTVSVIGVDSGIEEWSGRTDDAGRYRALSLRPGRYDIVMLLDGFKQQTTRGVVLQVGEPIQVDAVLSPGEIRDAITVEGTRFGRLERASGALDLVVDTAQLRSLPLPGRSVLNLLPLAGGVSAGGPATALNAAQLSVNGSRTLNNEFTVEGVSVLSGSTGGPTRVPSTEALREIKVLTSSYSAEYGRTSGGYVSVVVNSGTSSYRGGLYEFFRHQALNANDYFRTLRQQSKAIDRADQFGGTLGGPLTVPRLLDKGGRTFFFVNYEALRRKQPSTQTSTIPDAAFRAGDFSASPVRIVDPQTGQPFPGNRIPADRIDAAAARIMGLLPQPNAAGSFDRTTGRTVSNYILNETIVPANDELTTRVDHVSTRGDRISGHLTYYHLLQPSSRMIPGPLDPALGRSLTSGVQASATWTRPWSSQLFGETSAGFMRDDPVIDPPSLGVNVQETLGIGRSAFAAAPRLNVSGYSALGVHDNTYRRQASSAVQVASSLSWLKGAHSVKGGGQLRLNAFDVFNPGASFAGIYSFDGEVTSATRSAGNPVNALADFLLGQVQSAAYDIPQPRTTRRNFNFAAYLQDDWRATPRLTVNLGLRYEYESPLRVDGNIYSRIDPDSGRLLVAGVNASDTLNLSGDRLNLGPRVGAAFALNDRTVVRGGTGMFYSQIFSNLGGVVLFPGFTLRKTFQDLGVAVPQSFTLGEGHPLTAADGATDPLAVERNATPSSPLSASAQFSSASPLPRTTTWNVGVQRELGGSTLTLDYVGSRGTGLQRFMPFNQVPYERAPTVVAQGTALAQQISLPFPTLAPFAAIVAGGRSSYRALQAAATKRFGGRWGARLAYTWSRSMDDGSGLFNFSQPYGLDAGQFLSQFPDINWSVSAFDRPHVLYAAGEYTTSGPWWARGIVLSGVLSARSGLPDTITQTSLHPDAGQQRPGVRNNNGGGYAPSRAVEGTSVRYLLPTTAVDFPFVPIGPLFSGSGANRALVLAFTEPGNLGRNTTREPGELNVDLAVARRLRLGASVGLTLRLEAFNALNRVNLNGPDTMLNVIVDPATGKAAFNAPNFGLISSAKPPRTLQLAARVDF